MARRFPQLWQIPIMIRSVPIMMWHHYRKDYKKSMAVARMVMASDKIKSRAFKGYQATKHDVFVCTYSKSGTYWMLQIVTQIAGLGSAEFENIHDIVPWPETPAAGPMFLTDSTWEHSPTQLRAVKTHVEAQFVPYHEDATYIVVMRDPKDALVSSFYFSESIMPGVASLGAAEWTDSFITDQTPYGSWPKHIASFWPWRQRKNVHHVTFAEMKADLNQVVKNVADWMGVELSQDQHDHVVQRSSFGYMKAHETKFAPPTPSGKSELMRSGKKGESAEFLTPEQYQSIDDAMRDQLKALGSDFPYDEYFA